MSKTTIKKLKSLAPFFELLCIVIAWGFVLVAAQYPSANAKPEGSSSELVASSRSTFDTPTVR